MGAGAAKRLSAVRWGVAGNIVVAWVLTIPAAGSIGGVMYGITRIFGTGALGPAVVSVSILALVAAVAGRRIRRGGRMTLKEASQALDDLRSPRSWTPMRC